MGKRADGMRAEDMPYLSPKRGAKYHARMIKNAQAAEIARKLHNNPVGTSNLLRAIMSSSATETATARCLPSFDRPENEVIDLR